MKKLLVIASMFLVAATASAAELAAPSNKKDPNLNISATESHKNLYAAAPNLTINGNTLGDLTAAGGTVTLEGTVEQGLLLAGGNLFVNGPIGGNARIVGGNINISTSVGGDLVVAGGNVTLSDKASVGGDLVIAGGNVIVHSPVKGSIKFVGGDLTINSKVEGEINATVGDKLAFGPKAEAARVVYKSPRTAVIDKDAKLGAVSYQPAQKNVRGFAALVTAALVIKMLAWMLGAWLLLKLRPTRVEKVSEIVRQKPWESLGLGLLGLIGWPFVTALVLLTAIGYYVAIILGLFYALLILIGALLSAIFIGSLAMHYLTKGRETTPAWQIAVLGVILWQLLSFIPFFGWLAMALVYLMVFGSLMRIIRQEININN